MPDELHWKWYTGWQGSIHLLRKPVPSPPYRMHSDQLHIELKLRMHLHHRVYHPEFPEDTDAQAQQKGFRSEGSRRSSG